MLPRYQLAHVIHTVSAIGSLAPHGRDTCLSRVSVLLKTFRQVLARGSVQAGRLTRSRPNVSFHTRSHYKSPTSLALLPLPLCFLPPPPTSDFSDNTNLPRLTTHRPLPSSTLLTTPTLDIIQIIRRASHQTAIISFNHIFRKACHQTSIISFDHPNVSRKSRCGPPSLAVTQAE